MTQIDEGYFSARDGLRLYWQTRRPEGASRAHVAVLHGYAEHLGRYGELTCALNAAGYTAHLLDLRGHGHSGGKRAYVDGFGEYLSDLELFLARAREAAQGTPLFLIAHSNGALVAARYLLDKPDEVRGTVFSSPYFGLKLSVSPLKLLAGRLASRLLPALPMRNEIEPGHLTRDAAIQQATLQDPLYQRIATPRWFTEAKATQETVLRRATEFVAPFLCAVGGADPVADPAAARAFFDHATSKDKQFKRYEGLVHEIFHEPERDLVFKDVIAWLDARCGAGNFARPARAQGGQA
ncbi:MAG: alpha/beta hydrolase [Myxococcales bacterium]